jgi:hypothetical protein
MTTDGTKGTNDATQQGGRKLKGYPRLAGLMANSTNLMIFRRFNNLNIFNLLSLQAELVDLEEQLKDRWEDDDTSPDESEQQHSNFFKLLREPTDTQENKEQWKLLLKIREVLSKYSMTKKSCIKNIWKLTAQDEAVIQVETLTNMSTPDDQSFNTLQVLMNRNGGEDFPTDCEIKTWVPDDSKEDDKSDLFALINPSGENDGFQRWISSKPLLWFHKHVFNPLKRKFLSKEKNRRGIVDEETGMVNYNDATLDRISIFVALFITLGFLIGAIIALYFNKDILQRIGIMAGFTTAFGLTLTFFTTAKRIEIFSSTAALVLPIKELRGRTK